MDIATTLSSDPSSVIDHYGIQSEHDNDPPDLSSVSTELHLRDIASEKALRGYHEHQTLHIQECNLNLVQNTANLATFNRIFDNVIYSAISNEICLVIQ